MPMDGCHAPLWQVCTGTGTDLPQGSDLGQAPSTEYSYEMREPSGVKTYKGHF